MEFIIIYSQSCDLLQGCCLGPYFFFFFFKLIYTSPSPFSGEYGFFCQDEVDKRDEATKAGSKGSTYIFLTALY